MMMDTTLDTDGTAFICPECSFNGTSLPELITHLNEAHSEETASKSEAPPKNLSSISNEKRSRRKPAFSHQIISQAARQSLPLLKQSNVDPGSIHFWNRIVTADKDDRKLSESHTVRDENIILPNLSPQRPIAPKSIHSPTKSISLSPTFSSPSFHSSSTQPIQKNFQCRICHLTYKNFHDCTAHIRRKHEISHAQAGRHVGKLDTNVPLPPSATGHYKIRLKVKSLPPPPPPPRPTTTTIQTATKTYQCKHCSYTTPWLTDISRHEKQKHRSYSSFIDEDVRVDEDNGLSALLVDNVQSHDDELITIEDDIDDDDEDDALWKYQQEFNDLSDLTINNNHHPHQQAPHAVTQTFKKFQCPHCEHSSPTLTKLKLHIATHINVKPFMCSICGWRANLRWYIQCHAKKRHPNQNFEVLQLSHEEAEQTINAYIKEQSFDNKFSTRHDSKHQYQCSLCQFRSNHPRFIEQHIEANHTKLSNKPLNNHHSNFIQSDIPSSHLSNIVYPNFSSHPNFNPNRLYYCSLCYRGYRWRYDVKRHHKTMHETSEDELLKSRHFHYLEYVPHIDSLISATMLSSHNSCKNETEHEDEDDLKLSIADARTVDVTDDEAAALLMLEPDKSDDGQVLIDDHPEDSIIIFADDRTDKSSPGMNKPFLSTSSSRPSFKPYRCPYCFYRTNWRTDCLRHIRARHKIEPNQNGYYEMSNEEAQRTYDEYERTYGFVVAKKVLARFTDFRQMEWEELRRSLWDKIKDRTDFEQSIFDRLRPDGDDDDDDDDNVKDDIKSIPKTKLPVPTPIIVTLPNRISLIKPKRVFTCMDCAFRSHKLHELERHICSKIQKSQQEKSHGKLVLSLYECTKCSYRTVNVNYAKQHVYLHRFKDKTKTFYYCSSCGYNHQCRTKLLVHIAKMHSKRTSLNCLNTFHREFDADFSIRQAIVKRSFLEKQLHKPRLFHCLACPYVSTTIVEHDYHRACHQKNPNHPYRCQQCSFASNSSLYTNQHKFVHSKQARLLSSTEDMKDLQKIPVSIILKEILAKSRRQNCPFCKRFPSNYSSAILNHIKSLHQDLHGSLLIGSEIVKEILLL